jgi:hypothetical protein
MEVSVRQVCGFLVVTDVSRKSQEEYDAAHAHILARAHALCRPQTTPSRPYIT